MQVRKMLRPLCSLWLLAVMFLEWTSADDSVFCERPINMELCWFNQVNKRYLRFGRGDPFLRFGRGVDPFLRIGRSQTPPPTPGIGYRFGKRGADADDLENYLENGGYLRFGRSISQPPLIALLTSEGAHIRKRRDVSGETSQVQRSKREVQGNGFLRFGRGDETDAEGENSSSQDAKRADASSGSVPNGDREYLRFGRNRGFPRFGKRYLRFGRGREGYLRFGKRSMES